MKEGTRIAKENSRLASVNNFRTVRTFRVSLVAAAILIASLTVAPFFVRVSHTSAGRQWALGLCSTHDLNEHLVVMEQFDKSIRSSVLYPRWLAEINNGYGSAWTNFYPPVSYYVASAIHAVLGDWIATIAVFCILAMAASGISLYILSRLIYGRLASAMAAALYVLLPYHALDLYWRGALPELLGFVFLPLLIYFAIRLGESGRFTDYAGLGLTYGLYVMTHLPLAYATSYLLSIYAVIWAIREKNKGILLRIGIGMSLGLLICAIYLLPAWFESKYAYESISGIFPYENGYLPTLPPRGEFENILNHSFMLQAIALGGSLIVLRARTLAKGNPEAGLRSHTGLWVVMGISATVMTTAISFYVSRLIPRIDLVAFPWRWLAVSAVFTSLLVAAAIDSLSQNQGARLRRLAYVSLIVAVACVNVWFTAQHVIGSPVSSAPPSQGLIEENYTPRKATRPQDLPETARVETTSAGTATEIARWDPQERVVHVNADQTVMLRLKTYNFPGWTARIDGSVVPMLSDKDGVQQIQVPPGIHTVQATFDNTTPRTVGALLSAAGLLMLIALTLAERIVRRTSATNDSRQGPGIPDEHKGEDFSVASTRRRSKTVSQKTLVLSAILALVVVTIAFWIGTRLRSDIRRPSQLQTPAHSGSLSPDSEAHLYIAGRDSVLVATDEKALGEIVAALANRDTATLESLIKSGRVLNVPNNTTVRVLQVETGKAKIRLLDGDKVMVEGWVGENWLR